MRCKIQTRGYGGLAITSRIRKKNNSSTWIPQRPPLQSYILLMTLTRASQGKHDKIYGRKGSVEIFPSNDSSISHTPRVSRTKTTPAATRKLPREKTTMKVLACSSLRPTVLFLFGSSQWLISQGWSPPQRLNQGLINGLFSQLVSLNKAVIYKISKGTVPHAMSTPPRERRP